MGVGTIGSFLATAGVLLSLLIGSAASGSALTVACASSLQDVVRQLARSYEARHPGLTIHVTSGGSNLLARQIEEGAPVDLFLSADDRTIGKLITLDLVEQDSIVVLALNRVVVVSPADRVFAIDRPADLASPSIGRVALCDSTVPIGRYAAAFLRAAGIGERLAGRTVRTENARASLAAAALGAVDLAFVYATDARTSDRVRVVWRVAPETIPPVQAYGGPVERAEEHPATAAFLEFLQGSEAVAAFREAGFLPVDDDTR